MTKKLKWGVIGSGGIAYRRTIPEGFIPASNAELVVVYDINPERNNEIAREFSVKPADSISEVLSSEIDAVYIASPVFAHKEQVMKSAFAKKHILCEKPLGLNVSEAEEMVETCKNNEVKLGIGYMMKFHSQHVSARKLIKEGKLGNLVFGRAQLSCWYPLMEGNWRQNPELGGGGSLIDMGNHCIDLLEMYFGRIKSVCCYTDNLAHNYESEDSAVVSLKFESGAMATVDAFFCIPDNSSKNALEIYGSGGSIIAQGTLGQGESGNMIAYIEDATGEYDAQQARDDSDGEPIKPEPVNMYKAEIEAFGRYILDGAGFLNDAALALHSQKVMAACYESAKTGRIIQIDQKNE